ncbi:MAG TPA: 2,3-dihydro-2,3-dihydroxybenzoate synthetase [Stenotrophomonas sp.]|uniref:isochorismatase family protein n=1 Tax=Stenotrophomonas sp. SPM TaxID=2170735 RepID=UPI000DE6657A|nr:isochorismatase family protein [Stenotrophomonas sp. SPM]PWB30031.1 2,3-dihydro-2,3-dihydroxybenzoate synthetase [Stenotrophomonas sp. SPM]HCR32232.1 2,3-dihydro-2,3-dihydroxybenzoate synthetase [Stenotrophomonas sp.]
MALPRITPYPLPTAAELPAPRGPWRPQRDRIALLVHDMQRYFLAAFDAGAEPLQPAVANIARLLAHCRAHGIPVFYTAQHGDQDRRDRGLQADLWGPGMRRGEEHEPIIDALAPQAGEQVLVKHRYSAFQRSNLETLMRVRGRDQLLVTGVYAHIGCTATVVEAFQRDIEAFIAADAVADFSRADHDQALHWIARTSGVPMTTAQLLEVL